MLIPAYFMQKLKNWTLTKAQLATANKRSNDLGGEQNWLPPLMNLITKTYRLKVCYAHTCNTLMV